jgi:type II secretory pathway pseudopilin PulG
MDSTGGMTFIEVVVILLVLGILGFTAASRMTDGTADLLAASESVAAHLRLVQTHALNGSPEEVWGLRFEPTDNTYYMFRCPDSDICDMADSALPLPGAENDEQTQSGRAKDTDDIPDVAVHDTNKIVLNTNGNVAFDHFGRPCAIVGNNAELAVEAITISFQDGAGNTNAIQITPETGFIP